jgi:molecular chaperone IbpA
MTQGNTLRLRAADIPSIHKFGIGFDSMFDELLRITNQQVATNYPPYNIVQNNDDEITISLAVAGFGYDNLEVIKEGNVLAIEGNLKDETEAEVNYIHRGIGTRRFRREFSLADSVEIQGAHLELGILSINLKRIVPEEKQPKKIAITTK